MDFANDYLLTESHNSTASVDTAIAPRLAHDALDGMTLKTNPNLGVFRTLI